MGLFASTHTVNGSWGGARDLSKEPQKETRELTQPFPEEDRRKNNHFFLDWQVLKSPAQPWAHHQHGRQDLGKQPQLGWC